MGSLDHRREASSHLLPGDGRGQVTDEARKKGLLLGTCAPAIVELAQHLISPKTFDDCTFEELVNAVQNHYTPKPSEMTCHVAFQHRNQLGRETAAEFLAELRRLAADCKFEGHLEMALRDRFVAGLREEKLRRRIMEGEKVTIASAMATASAWERSHPATSTAHQANTGTPNSPDEDVHRTQAPRRTPRANANSGRQPPNTIQPGCASCGDPHDRNTCRFRGAVCRTCGRTGHIARACRAKVPSRGQPPRHRAEAHFEDGADSEDLYRIAHTEEKGFRASHPSSMM
ncbi:PREDICTED: uncharacterized protein LOC107108253 [Gekko japonicus]|uniref:Uncharacterized protein LOC107108253 n=1 Tax=Gekko japonicus TaxID=146911 RepID=A0ABM1JRR3_GEKJA|nr:PREDICTED: uncharacterized protein LOC107108253 [Gekko japonicus]